MLVRNHCGCPLFSLLGIKALRLVDGAFSIGIVCLRGILKLLLLLEVIKIILVVLGVVLR